jgi:N4-gp56 family major capsid protein
MAITKYGDISPRTAAYVSKELLERALPLLVLEKFMQAKPIPKNETKSITFRRYNSLDPATTPLVEGVTPSGKKLTKTDITATLEQYGDYVELTDVILDTHEDPILKETIAILGEQAALTVELIRYYVLRACTNKYYANGSARTDVNSVLTLDLQKKIVRGLKRQNARKITSVVKSTPSFNTQSVLPSFVALAHTDLENDIRAMNGFIDVKDYGNTQAFEGEIGAVNDVRYILSNVFEPYESAGGNPATNGVITTNSTNADVYPVIYLARDAWAGVPLKGAYAITPFVVNPMPNSADPLGQRGSVGWKTMQTSIILNDAWMAVAEVAAKEL